MSQSLEILPVFLKDNALFWLKPIHTQTLRVESIVNENPNTGVVKELERYGITSLVVHSTSWRNENDRMVLTYIALIPPQTFGSDNQLEIVPITRSELARGEATAAPKIISMDQVIEHALRHIAWLAKDDPVIAKQLSGWDEMLDHYAPEPFRAFRG